MNTTGDGGQPADDAADTDEGSTESTAAGRLRSVWNDRTGRRLLVAFAVGLLLVVAGTATASWVTTDGGDVTVEETTVETESGIELDATVYEPAGATAEEPRPGVLLIHGLGAERRTMSSFAVELADRGYVAVTLDQPGHGTSEPPAFADDWGGPAALSAVRSMETVDEDRVALVGHSMGGFASLAAARAHPDGHQSVVLLGSTYGALESPQANATFPRNVAVVFGKYDEFAPLMWNASVPANVDRSEKLARLFGTEPPVEHGRTYGSIENGTARRFTAPGTVHGAMFYSPTTIADTIEWLEVTIGDGESTANRNVTTSDRPGEAASGGLSPQAQRWHWATLGQVVAFIGSLLLAVSTTALVWRAIGRDEIADETAGGVESVSDADGSTNPLSSRTKVILTSIAALSLLPAIAIGSFALPTTAVTSQSTTNGFVLWGIASLLLTIGVRHWRNGLPVRETLRAELPERKQFNRAAFAGIAGAGVMYLCALLVDTVPGGALTAWAATVQPLTPARWVAFVVYLLALVGIVVTLSVGLARLLPCSWSLARSLRGALAVTCSGLLVLLLAQYVPLFAGFGMPIPLLGAVAISMLRALTLLAIITVLIVVTGRLTDTPWPGGVLAGLLVAWWLVSTAHVGAAV